MDSLPLGCCLTKCASVAGDRPPATPHLQSLNSTGLPHKVREPPAPRRCRPGSFGKDRLGIEAPQNESERASGWLYRSKVPGPQHERQ